MFQKNGSSAPPPTDTKPIEHYENGYEKRSLAEAFDEVTREIEVRQRVYPRWVRDGKLTETDACDRLQRLIAAAVWLGRLKDAAPAFAQELEKSAQDSA